MADVLLSWIPLEPHITWALPATIETAMTAEPAVSSSHVEHLLAEIESSDGLLGPTLRWSFWSIFRKMFLVINLKEMSKRFKVESSVMSFILWRFRSITSCRAVYDGEQHGEFMDKLEERIRVHDKDIERMCNYHYQGFIESVNELLKVRGEARKLKVF